MKAPPWSKRSRVESAAAKRGARAALLIWNDRLSIVPPFMVRLSGAVQEIETRDVVGRFDDESR